MPKIAFITPDERQVLVDADPGVSVMRSARNADVPGIIGECGGSATCLTCHVIVDSDDFDRLEPADAHEQAMLDVILESTPTSRLSCQLMSAVCGGMRFRIPSFQG